MMNHRVTQAVKQNARAFYEGTKSSQEAYDAIDTVANHFSNYYSGILNETRLLFDSLVDSFISEDVDEHRHETYASRELRRVRDTNNADEGFRLKVTGGADGTKWVNVTPAQMDALIRVFEV
jgi:hypothetical protein